jgi:Ubiquitin family
LQALKVRAVGLGDVVMAVSNHMSVVEFKQAYLNKINDRERKIENLRLFCMGKELKDDLFLYSYEIADEMVLQAMYKK